MWRCTWLGLFLLHLSEPAKEKSRNTSPLTWGSWSSVFWKMTRLAGWTAKIAKKTFKVCLCNCLLYVSGLASAFRCLVLRIRVYSASCLSKHWKFGSSVPDKTSGSSGLVSCLWQWLTSDSGSRDVCALGCRDRLGTTRSHPACPEQKTLWFHIIAPSLVLIHHKMLEMLLQKTLIVFINSTCRPAAVQSFLHRGCTGILPWETSCGFCSCTPTCPCIAPPWCAGVFGHG